MIFRWNKIDFCSSEEACQSEYQNFMQLNARKKMWYLWTQGIEKIDHLKYLEFSIQNFIDEKNGKGNVESIYHN